MRETTLMAFTRGVGVRPFRDSEIMTDWLFGDRSGCDKGPGGLIKTSTALKEHSRGVEGQFEEPYWCRQKNQHLQPHFTRAASLKAKDQLGFNSIRVTYITAGPRLGDLGHIK
jgi:hypothetical protein